MAKAHKKGKNINRKGNRKMAEPEKNPEEEKLEKEEVKETEETLSDKEVIESLNKRIAELEETIAKQKDDDLRRMADTENYKKRLRLEKENAVKYANEQLIEDLLQPIDNFSRAIESADKTSDFEAMKQGVVMVEDQLLSILKSKWGLEAIEAEGKEFDPSLMEAYSMQEKDDIDKEIVLQEFAKGWKLNGKVLRSSKVLVGKPKNK